MSMSRTKKFKTGWIICSVLSFLLTFGPLIYFGIEAFITTGVVHYKMALCGSLAIVLMITVICKLREYKPRSLPWIVLIALWIALDSLGAIIIAFTVTQCLDEFVVSPLKRFCRTKYTINKEIDLR